MQSLILIRRRGWSGRIASLPLFRVSFFLPSFLFLFFFRLAYKSRRRTNRHHSALSRRLLRQGYALNLKNFDFLSNVRARNRNLYLCTKFDRNRIIHGRDMEIKLFSKWRPSAILTLRKLQFWSRDIYRHAILHHCSKFRVDRPIWRRDIAKKLFSIWRPSAILNLQNYRFLLKIHNRN